jgi:hypothetical protein
VRLGGAGLWCGRAHRRGPRRSSPLPTSSTRVAPSSTTLRIPYQRCRLDVDRDGDQDLLVLIAGDPSSIPDGATSVTLTGELDDGTPIAGDDTICTSTTPTNRRAMPG